MQFNKGIICRKLSRKYEFHDSWLNDSCTSGHKLFFSCKFHIFWLNWVMFAVEYLRVIPFSSYKFCVYNESDTLCGGINEILPLLSTFFVWF
jgi:hypothetical protein